MFLAVVDGEFLFVGKNLIEYKFFNPFPLLVVWCVLSKSFGAFYQSPLVRSIKVAGKNENLYGSKCVGRCLNFLNPFFQNSIKILSVSTKVSPEIIL